MNPILKKIFKIIGIILAVLVVLVVGYVIYFFASYHRIDDHQELTVDHSSYSREQMDTGTPYSIITFNLGFGAYSKDYGFFMDGGTESWAFSEQAVQDNLEGCLDSAYAMATDFCLFQEVDIDGTRSYHVDEDEQVKQAFARMDHVRAIDYDSPFIMYPLTQPHGKNLSSIVTTSSFTIGEAQRRSLPIDQGLSKVLDLDRCFSVSEIQVANGKKLYLYNVHLSAYSNESDTVKAQVQLLSEDIQSRYEGGNYIIVGGDFNQDVLSQGSQAVFGTTGDYSWAKPFAAEELPEFCTLVQPTDQEQILPTCRMADGPYVEGQSFVISIDSFIVSDNVKVTKQYTMDMQFNWSDHNPVIMEFELK